MSIFDLFSKRQKKLRGDVPDVYTYDSIPNKLRAQIVHIIDDGLGNSNEYNKFKDVRDTYKLIVDILCREYGVFKLAKAEESSFIPRCYYTELLNSFLQETDNERVVDMIELSFKAINTVARQPDYAYRRFDDVDKIADNAISEVNLRFKEHGVGYEFVNNEIVKIDSQLIHSEVVKPALRLLNQKYYQGPQEEFLKAHEHYRHGRNKEALNDCLKSFESTMKAICNKRQWYYDSDKDTAKNLIDICFKNGLIPLYWQQNLNSLRSSLEGSIPTGRNRTSGHGQGSTPTTIPDYLTAYMLHMTASTILFMITAEESLL